MELKIHVRLAAHTVPDIIKDFKGQFGADISEESVKVDLLQKDYRYKDIHVKGPISMRIYTFYFGSDTDFVTILHLKGKNRLFYYSSVWGISDEKEEAISKWMAGKGVASSANFKVQSGKDSFEAQIWKV
jgi:hypothetical protein